MCEDRDTGEKKQKLGDIWVGTVSSHEYRVRERKTDRGRRTGFRKDIEESGQMWLDIDSRAGMC